MIHIVKSGKHYYNVAISSNGEVLNASEILFSKQKCFQNARAQLKDCFVSLADHLWPAILVQDDTASKSVVWAVGLRSKIKYVGKPEKKYKPKK